MAGIDTYAPGELVAVLDNLGGDLWLASAYEILIALDVPRSERDDAELREWIGKVNRREDTDIDDTQGWHDEFWDWCERAGVEVYEGDLFRQSDEGWEE